MKELNITLDSVITEIIWTPICIKRLERKDDESIEYYSKLKGYECAAALKFKQIRTLESLGLKKNLSDDDSGGIIHRFNSKINTIYLSYYDVVELDTYKHLQVHHKFSQ